MDKELFELLSEAPVTYAYEARMVDKLHTDGHRYIIYETGTVTGPRFSVALEIMARFPNAIHINLFEL